jgi:hypothetical protein
VSAIATVLGGKQAGEVEVQSHWIEDKVLHDSTTKPRMIAVFGDKIPLLSH